MQNMQKLKACIVQLLHAILLCGSQSKRSVIRGGSWKDIAYFLRVSARDYEYKDEKRSYVGFRTVQDYLGEDIGINDNPNKVF